MLCTHKHAKLIIAHCVDALDRLPFWTGIFPATPVVSLGTETAHLAGARFRLRSSL
jgi:hypothetical protein